MNEFPNILFVDDEEYVLTAIQRHFLDDDYEIHTAHSGKEALEILRTVPVQVVVSDYRMPEMNGGELLRIVSQQWPETVRIVLSGYADISAVISAINDGAIFKFVTKPWDESELRLAVQEALDKHRNLVQMRQLAEMALAEASDLIERPDQAEDELMRRNADLDRENRKLKRYKYVFDALPMSVLLFDENGQLCDATSAAQRLFDENYEERHMDSIPSQIIEMVTSVLAGKSISASDNTYVDETGNRWSAEVISISAGLSPRGVIAILKPE
jgi:two-component system NtrC family sensor kinase